MENLIWTILIGLVAGTLASQVIKGQRFGIAGNIAIGVHLSGKKIAGARRVVLFVRRFRCGRGDDLLEARVAAERIP